MTRFFSSQQVRYLCVSGANAVYGYAAILSVYALFYPALNMLAVGVVANVLGISFSFLTYRVFVFKSHDAWWKEYLRCYLVYGASALVSSVGLWLFVDVGQTPVWLASLVVIAATYLFSYFGHSRFTFRPVRPPRF